MRRIMRYFAARFASPTRVAGLVIASLIPWRTMDHAQAQEQLKPVTDACCKDSATNAVASQSTYLVTPWLAATNRTRALPAKMEWTNQDGKRGVFEDFQGKPLALSFSYTRCTNPNKCVRVSEAMAKLQREVEKSALKERVRLLLVTYDPEFDTPAVLRDYAKARGIEAGKELNLLRLSTADNRKLLDQLEAAVNFNAGGVNMHGIQLFLFDAQGRWVRTYKTLLWNNENVLHDLTHLAAETKK